MKAKTVLCMLALSALLLLGCSKAKKAQEEEASAVSAESRSGPLRPPQAPPPPGEANCVVAHSKWSNWDRAVREADVVLIALATSVTKYANTGDGKWVYAWYFNRFPVVQVRRGALDLRRLSFVTVDVLPHDHCEKPAPWARKGQVWALALSTSSGVPTILGMERRSILPPHERLVVGGPQTAIRNKRVLESVRSVVEERYGPVSVAPFIREETPSYFGVELLGDIGKLEASWMTVDKTTFNVRFISPPRPAPPVMEIALDFARPPETWAAAVGPDDPLSIRAPKKLDSSAADGPIIYQFTAVLRRQGTYQLVFDLVDEWDRVVETRIIPVRATRAHAPSPVLAGSLNPEGMGWPRRLMTVPADGEVPVRWHYNAGGEGIPGGWRLRVIRFKPLLSQQEAMAVARDYLSSGNLDWGEPTKVLPLPMLDGEGYKLVYPTRADEEAKLGKRVLFVSASSGRVWLAPRR